MTISRTKQALAIVSLVDQRDRTRAMDELSSSGVVSIVSPNRPMTGGTAIIASPVNHTPIASPS